jgi:hypothetical protein
MLFQGSLRMRPDYVLLASDNNPLYLDFLPIVSKQWKEYIGIDVFFIHITDNDSDIKETSYGLYKAIRSVPSINTGLQAQVSRLYAPYYLPTKTFLTSDIDMLPLSKAYFTQDHQTSIDKLLLYTSSPYSDTPYHAMCYVLGYGQTFIDILKVPGSFTDFCHSLNSKYQGAWNTDEHYLYDCVQGSPGKAVYHKRVISKDTRICRSNWTYTVDKLQRGEYIDSHLLRPYTQYKDQIIKLQEECPKLH